MTDRIATESGRLIRAGFRDLDRAQRLLEEAVLAPLLGIDADQDLLSDLGGAADPDLALLLMVRILESAQSQGQPRLRTALAADADLRRRLIEVIGMSEALGEFLERHPSEWEVLADGSGLTGAPSARDTRAALITAVGGNPEAPEPVAARPGVGPFRTLHDPGADECALDALRVAYRRLLLGIAARDLCGIAPMETVARWLADLADGVMEAALAIARSEVGPEFQSCRFAVIGMGKCGARELNYVSDVDVIFVAEPADGVDEDVALRVATRLATSLMRACSASTAEGTIWEVDPNLRPEGKQGALVRTLSSHEGYYERWAQSWEFQALLKARLVAGDEELGAAYLDATRPFVWSAADHPTFVEDAQAMRRRVESHIPARLAERELKLGPGGLRDVEFSVQLLQLVHGRSDVMLRSPNTLEALEALATWGYVGREDASTLAEAYRFLRTLEHRIQLHRLRRTHTMPEAEEDLRRLGRSLGLRKDPVEELITRWKQHARQVRRIHEKLFYRPLLNAVARLDAGDARLSPEAAEERLRALGYADPAGALRHLQALTSGVSRRAAIQRTLLPVMLGWFADTPDPDAGLLGFRRVSDVLGATHWYLRLLRDESVAAERMARILGTSRYATELLLGAPEAVTLLADDEDLVPRPREALASEMRALIDRHEDPERAVAAIRAVRRRELFRIAASSLLQNPPADVTGESLTDVAAAAIDAALAAIRPVIDPTSTVEFTVIGMGRFGGHELGYGSDADVMFVYRAGDGVTDEQAQRTASSIAEELRRLLMAPSADPPLDIDADLRPEGRQGPLVRSLDSYAAYYERWSATWEAQALLRADVVAGDENLGEDFMSVVDAVRWDGSLTDVELLEVRRLKARMESERLPRGADPTLHTKLGRGGLSDVEWVVQLLQMRHGAQVEALRSPRTLSTLAAASGVGLVTESDARQLADAWRLATAIRGAVMLARGRASDMVPTDVAELRSVAYILGYTAEGSGRLLEEYRRVTRQARRVFDRLFYGVVDE